MALFYGLCRPNNLLYRIIFSSLYGKNFIYNERSDQSSFDTLDHFTTQLLAKKTDKWRAIQKYKKGSKNTVINNSLKHEDVDINMEKQELNELFQGYLEKGETENIQSLAQKCLENRLCPSLNLLQYVFSVYARMGDEETLIKLKTLAEEFNSGELKAYGDFLHYFAEALWIKKKTNESLALFYNVYKENRYLRRKIRLILRHLFSDITTESSEAILVQTIKFSERLNTEFNDYYLLTHIWQVCFLSEWYSDQVRASELLMSHKKLLSKIVGRIPHIIQRAFYKNDPEMLHRLLELLLQHEVKSEYPKVLQALFSYRYWQGDLSSCYEIIQWSVKLDIPLLQAQEIQFVNLLLKSKQHDGKPDKPTKPPEYKLKF